MSTCILSLLARRIFFSCFGMSCFGCIVLFCLDIFLVSLRSPVPSYLFLRVVLFDLLVVFFSFRPYVFQHFTSILTFLLVVVDFLYAFLSNYSSRF